MNYLIIIIIIIVIIIIIIIIIIINNEFKIAIKTANMLTIPNNLRFSIKNET